jgi:hypothetical protein
MRPVRLRQIPARFCEAHRDDRLAEWSFDDATFNRTAAAFNNPDHVAIVIRKLATAPRLAGTGPEAASRTRQT